MFEKLKLFVEIANVQNISQAADKLYIAQSSASGQLKLLEEQVGSPLFDRVGRGIRLNESGELFLEFATATLKHYQNVLQSIEDRKEREADSLSICAGVYFNVYFLPSILPLFEQHEKNVYIHVITKTSAAVLKDVIQKTYEFGIVGAAEKLNSPLIHTDFSFTLPLWFVCAPQNPLARRAIVTPDDIAGETFILSKEGSNYRQHVEGALHAHGFHFAKYMSNNSMEAIKVMVAKNFGVSILSQYMVKQEIEEKKLVHIPLAGLSIERKFCCVHNIERPLSKVAQKFIALAIEVLNEQEHLRNDFPDGV